MTARDDAFSLRLGTRITRARRARGWTQARLAEEIDIDARSLQRIEAGRTAPSLRRLQGIAEALGVSCGELLDGTPSAKRPPTRQPKGAQDRSAEDERTSALLRTWSRLPASRRTLALAILAVLADEPS